jgi:hypothetical protein
MKIKLQHGRIIKAAKLRNTIWVLTCLDKKNREQFLGAYPSSTEAEQAAREEFGHRKEPMVCGYDAALLP